MKKKSSGIKKPNLYYIGDLPSYRCDGITISFEINLKILSELFTILNVPEQRKLNQNSLKKSFEIVKLWIATFMAFRTTKPDVLYLNYPLSLLGSVKIYLLLMMAKRKSAKRVLHIHRGDFFSLYLTFPYNRWWAKRIINLSDKILVLSEKERRNLSSKYKNSKFYLLPNSIENEEEESKYKSQSTRLIFISNYLESKGIFDLLEVFLELISMEVPDLHNASNLILDCYGAFPNIKIKERLLEYQSKNIIINDGIYGKEKFETLNNASCLILPSWNEGQPLVILEAMSRGIPVIASDVGFVKEMLGEEYPYLFPLKEKDKLKRTIKKFLDSRNNEAIGGNLKQRYYKYFSKSGHRKNLLRIFNPMSF